MDFNDAELARLIQDPDSMLRVIPPGGVENNNRANPVQRHLQLQQPQLGPFQPNNWRPDMPANGGYKKKRTNKNCKKYKNKNRKRQTRRAKKMK